MQLGTASMNSNLLMGLLSLALGGSSLFAAPRSSTTYNIPAEALSAGGGSSSSSTYTHDSILGLVGGIQTAANPPVQIVVGFFTPQEETLLIPEIDVDAASLSFGPVAVGGSSSLNVVIRNQGTGLLTLSRSFLGAHLTDYTTSAFPESLAAGAQVTVTVTFAPGGAGERSALLQINSNDDNESLLTLSLTGIGTLRPEPAFVVQPQSQLVRLGSQASFTPTVTGDLPMTFYWKKGTLKIANTANVSYSLSVTKTTDAAAYSLVADNPVGNPVTSLPAYLGIVTPISGTQVLKKGAALNLKATVAAPTGVGVSTRYSWRRDGSELTNGVQADGSVVSGATRAALSITKIGLAEAGEYSCLITLDTPGNDPEVVNGMTLVRVVDTAPVMNAVPLPGIAYVGQVVDETISATNFPSGFQVTGLPLGLKMDVKTGRITGQLTTASKVNTQSTLTPFKISFKATNAWGTGVVLDFFMTIQPLPALSVGTFNGLVDRSAALNAGVDQSVGLGGTLKLTTASTGAFTGSLKLGTVVHALKGTLMTLASGGNPSSIVVIPRRTSLTALTLAFTINSATGVLTGSVKDAVTVPNSVNLSAVRASKSPSILGLYNSGLLSDAPGNDLAYPRGTGYLTMTVAATGVVSLGGKLADGTAITGSSQLGPDGQVPVHLLLYTNTGSAQGWSQITAATVDGTLDWFKAAQPIRNTTRSYKNGFLLHALSVEGGKYIKPTTGLRVMDLASGLQVTLSAGGLTNPIAQLVTLTTANALAVPTNSNNVKLTLNATTGLITGSFTQPGITAVTSRKADIYGALIPGSASGVGFFNLSENPDTPGETAANTPMNSGSMLLKAP